MAITATDVKKLRDMTGAGMMDAKKALTDSDGDFEKAVELLRITGASKAAKRSDREASNGIVAASGHALVQLGAETDFVAKNEEFVTAAQQIVEAVDQAGADSVEAALTLNLATGETVADRIAALVAKIGEKIELVKVARFAGQTQTYLHHRSQDLPPQVGVLVEYQGDDADLIRMVTMQIASMSPQFVSRDEVPQETVANERRIAEAAAREEGTPEQAIARSVEGGVGAFFKDVCLVDQPAISDDKQSVGTLLKKAGITVTRFVRFAAGA